MRKSPQVTTDVLITGTGALGMWALEFLARSPGLGSLAAADLDEKRGAALTARAAVGASQQGYMPRLSFHTLDLKNVDATASLLAALRPSAVFHTATLLPIWAIHADVEPTLFSHFREVGFAVWLPFHLLLTHRLMTAVRQTGSSIDVISAPFPDFVNPVLAKVDLSPLGGCGNVDNIAGGLRLLTAQRYGVALADAHVHIVASHSVSESFTRDFSSGGAPYHARVAVCGVDVTAELDVEEMLAAYARSVQGVPMEARVASSAVKSVLALAKDGVLHTHMPGPGGVPGGYPVRLSRGRVEIMLPPGLSMAQALDINRTGLRKGGIAEIDEDGTVTFTDAVATCHREVFGLELPKLRLSDVEEVATELRARYQAMIARARMSS